jgi:hypothetical protein
MIRKLVMVSVASLILFAGESQAQRLVLTSRITSSYNQYAEHFINPEGYPAKLEGTSIDLPGLWMRATLDSRIEGGSPFLDFEAELPIVSFKGTEFQTFVRNGETFKSQERDVKHQLSYVTAAFGVRARWFMMAIAVQRSRFVTIRSNFFNGTDSSGLVADTLSAYSEYVYATHAGLRLSGERPVTSDLTVGYRIEYLVPSKVFASNEYSTARYGIGALGGETHGISRSFQLHAEYKLTPELELSLSGEYFSRHWDGDGHTAISGPGHLLANIYWPANTLHRWDWGFGVRYTL